MDSFKVVLEGPAPWGFRLQGGKDFNVPLSISRVSQGCGRCYSQGSLGVKSVVGDGKNLSRSEPGPVGQEVSRSRDVVGTHHKGSQPGGYWERSTHSSPALSCT